MSVRGSHLGGVVGALAGLWQSATLYPVGHPARLAAADRLAAALRQAGEGAGTLVLDLERGRLEAGSGDRAPVGEGHLGGLLAAARERGVGRVRLAGPGDVDLLAELVGALAEGREPPTLPALPGDPAGPGEGARGTARGTAADPAGGLVLVLGRLWGEIASARRFVDEEADRLVRGIAALPGDGLVDPVRLVPRADDGDPGSVEHALDIARVAYLVGRTLGLDPGPLRDVTLAAALADIGMLEVSPSILGKRGSLTPEEFRVVRRHPVAGAEMLLATPGVPDLAGVVAWQHHQRRGGGGYPADPVPGTLHPVTWIVQVADVYTALRSPRAFRPEIPEARARAILERLARTWLDPEIVRLVLERVAPLGLAPAETAVPA